MQLLKRLFNAKKEPPKLFVLGLDGLGMSWLKQTRPIMPALQRLLRGGAVTKLTTPLPAESQVAWASFATGQNPGQHGVFGLVDRNPNPFETFISSALEIASPTIWEIIGQQHKSLSVMNVPLTYPPRPLNGLMVGCSLTPGLDLAHACWPMEVATRLLELNYRIEPDNTLALNQPEAYLADLMNVMGCRFRAAGQLMQSEPFSFWQLHDLSLDRLNRLFYAPPGELADAPHNFGEVYEYLDSCLAELLSQLPQGCRLVLVSTHGFSACHTTFMLNSWLEENGYLHFARNSKNMANMHPSTKAYSLAPGRVYINLNGREAAGSVVAGKDYDELRSELKSRLLGLRLPNSQMPVLRAAHYREDIYRGAQLALAPDLILEPMPGVDLRSNLNAPGAWHKPLSAGLPDKDDGFVFIQGMQTENPDSRMDIIDLAPTLLAMLEIAPPPFMEGRPQV